MNIEIFTALAEQNRFQIVELLRDKPYTVGELVLSLHLRQPQVSKHLKVLADAGIVVVQPKANQRIYALNPKTFLEIDAWLESYRRLWEKRFDQLDALLQKEKQHLKQKKEGR